MKKLLFCTVILATLIGCSNPSTKNKAGSPIINPPTVTGNFPNTPFLFAIPTQGVRPIKWIAEGLPQGLEMDATTAFITGNVKQAGEYTVKWQKPYVKLTGQSFSVFANGVRAELII